MIRKIDAAHEYVRSGWFVFPCHSWVDGACTCGNASCSSAGKHPLTTNGCKDATTSPEKIDKWWSETQGMANVAVATGTASGLVVLDIDPKSNGLASLADLEDMHGKLPATPTVQTGSGGLHYYFRYPSVVKIGNRAGILPGIDVRGDGGYVIAPPSVHASGSSYSWLVPPTAAVAEIPGWLLGLIQDQKPGERPAAGMVLKMAGTLDLATAAGAGEGQRHDTLCRLVGAHLCKGEEPDAVLPLARAWANRCSPPLPDDEVVRVVWTLAQKEREAATLVTPADPLDEVPLPEETAWPRLDEAALYGRVGELVRTVEPCSEADPAGLLLTALVALGNCIGRTPTYAVEGNCHHVNLFAVLVGESSRARKGTSLGRVMSLFDQIDSDWKQHRKITGLSSGEGLIWAVRNPIEGIEVVKSKEGGTTHQVVVKDPGVKDKRLLVNESEFAQVLRVLRREGNTLSPIIRQAWDEGDIQSLTKNSPAQATNAHISIIGHITRQELSKYLDGTDIFNGFANRFLWAAVRRSKLLPDGGQEVDLTPLKLRLTKAVEAAKQISSMTRCPEARSLWWSVYPELTAERPGLYGAVTGRGEAQVLRLSMLYALLDGSPTIDVTHLQAAMAVWRFCDASARKIFQRDDDETTDPVEKSLLAAIRRQPGVNRKGLHKALGGHLQGDLMVNALGRLRHKGLVRMEMVPTGGRPGECWFPRERTSKAPPLAVPIIDPVRASTPPDQAVPSFVSTEIPSGVETSLKDSSFARTNKAITSVADLFVAVEGINGRLVWQGDKIGVDAPSDLVTPDLLAAVNAQAADLLPFMPPRPKPARVEESDEPLKYPDDPFVQKLLRAIESV